MGGILMNIAYGFDPKSKDDPYIAEALEVQHAFEVVLLPGAFLVERIPLLKYVPAWMPGAGFKRFAEYYRNATYSAQRKPFNFATDAMRRMISEKNEVQPCVTTKMVDSLPDADDPMYAEVKDDLMIILGASYMAGVDSTTGVLSMFITAMATYPEVQEKAQAEMDKIVGPGRLPDFGDRNDLIYIKALIIELLRWHQIAPFAMPHKTTEDDFYDGYFIPKGTIVLGNAWAVLHDPDVFENPMEFIPERYIKNGNFNDDLINPLDFAFGYGRRICPGRYLAMDMLYLAIASILSMFEILPPKDATGAPVKIELSFGDGAIPVPEPFEVMIRPRSNVTEKVIQSLSE
ncbi:hypothetical protein EST38_g7088 [Candolleomyces aberdarensis]|uniref:O-methylsterigmatocystin oxidoreductase n=1 Tax=Candolleomyces aberdarensis TaxID=2316362 RepID=A0A4Q2DG57_9AGAR|nr:hypothetical protein EST38_g7088 [Candolleomyces aberdarensis]